MVGEHIRTRRDGSWTHGIDCGDQTVIHLAADAGRVLRSYRPEFVSRAEAVEVVTHRERTFPAREIVARAYSRIADPALAAMFRDSEAFAEWCATGRLPAGSPNLAVGVQGASPPEAASPTDDASPPGAGAPPAVAKAPPPAPRARSAQPTPQPRKAGRAAAKRQAAAKRSAKTAKKVAAAPRKKAAPPARRKAAPARGKAKVATRRSGAKRSRR
jgi:hypothetical protein